MAFPDIRTTLLEIIPIRDAYIRKDPLNGTLQQGIVLEELQKLLGWSLSLEMDQFIHHY